MILLSLVLAAWTSAADFRAPKTVVLPPGPFAAPSALPTAGIVPPALPAAALPAAPPEISANGGNLGAADALRGLGAELAKPGSNAASPAPALAAAFDGTAGKRGAVSAAYTGAPIDLGAVSAANPIYAVRLREIIAAANTTKTGRRIMKRAEALAKTNGPVPVSFAALGTDFGAYEYTEGRMELNRSLLTQPPAVAAATLVHELVHVLQHAEGLPAEALELELEAHMLTLEFLDEAGLRPDSSFSLAARRELEQGPQQLHDWMSEQLASKFTLRGSTPEDIEAQLEEDYDKLQERLDKISGTAKNRHRREKLQRLMAWTLSDLELIRSPEGMRRYRALARRVHARARRLSVKYAAPPLPPSRR